MHFQDHLSSLIIIINKALLLCKSFIPLTLTSRSHFHLPIEKSKGGIQFPGKYKKAYLWYNDWQLLHISYLDLWLSLVSVLSKSDVWVGGGADGGEGPPGGRAELLWLLLAGGGGGLPRSLVAVAALVLWEPRSSSESCREVPSQRTGNGLVIWLNLWGTACILYRYMHMCNARLSVNWHLQRMMELIHQSSQPLSRI